MSGYSNPGTLFIGGLREQERKYLKKFIVAARGKGCADIVEPCCGSFALSRLAVEAGYQQNHVDASDVSFYSAVLGRAITGQSLADLEISIQGFPGEDFTKPEAILWAHKVLCNTQVSSSYYQSQIIDDLYKRKDFYQANIRAYVDRFRTLIGGIRFRELDMFEHIEEYLGNEKAILLLCPPTYKGGYEKFFYSGEMLFWKEPAYSIFDPKTDVSRIIDDLCGTARCLVLCYAETKMGQCPGSPIFCRADSRAGMNSYLTTNDPDRAAYILGEKNATRRPELSMIPLQCPVLSDEHEITSESAISVYEIENANALYYRRLWTHNFSGSVSAFPNFAVVVDGFLCGVFGFNSMNASMFSTATDGKVGLWVSYSISAPVQSYRIIRLNTLVSLCRSVVEAGQSALVNQRIEGVYTTMITTKPNSMIHRGIMKLARRERMNQLNNKLVYYADILERTPQDVFQDWLKKEQERKLAKNREVEGK